MLTSNEGVTMIYLDQPTQLLGVDGESATYWSSDYLVVAIDPTHCTRVLHLNDDQKFVFLDDALPLDVCFLTDSKIVAKINWGRVSAGLPETQWYLKHVILLTPLPSSPMQ